MTLLVVTREARGSSGWQLVWLWFVRGFVSDPILNLQNVMKTLRHSITASGIIMDGSLLYRQLWSYIIFIYVCYRACYR